MKKIIIGIIILLLVAVGIVIYYKTSNNPSPITSKTPIPKGNSVDIKNLSFNPSVLTIKAGTEVTWINNDTVAHTVTSDVPNLFNSPTLAPGESFSFTFKNISTINYHCSIHPTMKGTVIVTESL